MTRTSISRPLAAAVALMAAVGLGLVAAAPQSGAEGVRVTPKVRAVEYVAADRNRQQLRLEAKVVNTARQRLSLQQWALDAPSGGDAELLVSWLAGDRTARVFAPGEGQVADGCRRLPVQPLADDTGARIVVPDRCLRTGVGPVRRVGIRHTTVMTVRRPGTDTCRVYDVPRRRGFLGPLGRGQGVDRHAYGRAGAVGSAGSVGSVGSVTPQGC